MKNEFELNAEIREDQGKGASRRLRRSGKIPAVIYGAGKEAVALSIKHSDIFHALENEAFYSHVITLNVGKKKEKAILKDLQRHAWKPFLTHADFLRVSAKEKLTTHVPLHLANEDNCAGVKNDGGIIIRDMNEVEVSCLPKDLPEFIEIDIAELALGETIHLATLKMPKGVELVALSRGDSDAHNLGVVSVIAKKTASNEDDTEVDDDLESPVSEGDAE